MPFAALRIENLTFRKTRFFQSSPQSCRAQERSGFRSFHPPEFSEVVPGPPTPPDPHLVSTKKTKNIFWQPAVQHAAEI